MLNTKNRTLKQGMLITNLKFKANFFILISGGGRDLQTAVIYAKNSSIQKQAQSNNNSLLISNQPRITPTATTTVNNTMPKKTNTSVSSGKFNLAYKVCVNINFNLIIKDKNQKKSNKANVKVNRELFRLTEHC